MGGEASSTVFHEDFDDIVHIAEINLGRPTLPAMPCITSQLATLCEECEERHHVDSGDRPARVSLVYVHGPMSMSQPLRSAKLAFQRERG